MAHIIKKITNFFITSPLFIAANFVFVVLFSTMLYGITVTPVIVISAFFTTIAIYSLNRVTDHTEDKINRPNRDIKKQKHYGIIAAICYSITLIISATKGIIAFFTLLTPLIIGIIYSAKIFKKRPRLKTILGVKNVAVAFSWAFTGAFLPTLTNTVATKEIILVFLYIFIQLIINTILFDAIDMPGDKAAKVKTIPLQLGKKKTRQLLLIINSLLILWLSFCLASNIFTKYLPIAAFGMLYSYITIWYFTTKENKRLLTEIFVDGQWIPIIILMLLITH